MIISPLLTLRFYNMEKGEVLQTIHIYPDGHLISDPPIENIDIQNNLPPCCVPKLEKYLSSSPPSKYEIGYDKPPLKPMLGIGFPHIFAESWKTMSPSMLDIHAQVQKDYESVSCGLLELEGLNNSKKDLNEGSECSGISTK